MGIAAYNRGSKAISHQIDNARRNPAFVMMDELNSLPKDPKAATPFATIQFVAGHGGWWAECPRTGFGYWFGTLRAAVRHYNVQIVAYADGIWTATPAGNYGVDCTRSSRRAANDRL